MDLKEVEIKTVYPSGTNFRRFFFSNQVIAFSFGYATSEDYLDVVDLYAIIHCSIKYSVKLIMLNPKFETGGVYHIYNRGVDKRDIFLDDKDRLRFIHNLFEFNDENPAPSITLTARKLSQQQSSDTPLPKIVKAREPRKLLVEILVFCLMNNHYHLLIRQLVDGGVSLFMRKLGVGYTNYINLKNKRSGYLFQGTFKAIEVKNEAHFIHLPYYIHLNPLDYFMPDWRDRKIISVNKALKFLESYRWSSHLDFMGIKNFSSVTQRDHLLDFFEGVNGYQNHILDFLNDIDFSKLETIKLD